MSTDNSTLWDIEYEKGGIPSSSRQRPSNVVVDFMERAFKTLPDRPSALDIGAGQGRNSLFLARKGFQVTALDYSARAVSELRSAAAVEQVDLRSLVQDVSLPWQIESASQDVAIDTFCFKHIIEEAGIDNYRQEIGRVLRPRGWLMLFLASKNDDYYRQFPASDQHGIGEIIRDPGNGIRSRLYNETEIHTLFADFEFVFESKKTARNEMHGQTYDRESLIFFLRK